MLSKAAERVSKEFQTIYPKRKVTLLVFQDNQTMLSYFPNDQDSNVLKNTLYS